MVNTEIWWLTIRTPETDKTNPKVNFSYIFLKEQYPGPDIFLAASSVKNDTATFEVNATHHSQYITKKQPQG